MNLLIATVIRLVMIIVGMFLGTKPDEIVIDEKNVEMITGAVLVVLAGAWGIWEKIKLGKVGIKKQDDAERRTLEMEPPSGLERRGIEDPADARVQADLAKQAKQDLPRDY
jgi:hypothetical protein